MSNNAHVQSAENGAGNCNPDDCRAELEQLRLHKKTLEGKIEGYRFLGKRLKEKDEECRNLKQQLAEQSSKVKMYKIQEEPNAASDRHTPDTETSEKTIQTSLHLLNGFDHKTNDLGTKPLSTPLLQTSTHTTDLYGSGPKVQQITTPKDDDYLFPKETANMTNQKQIGSNKNTIESDRLFPSEARDVCGPPGNHIAYPPKYYRQESQPFLPESSEHRVRLLSTQTSANDKDQPINDTFELGLRNLPEVNGFHVPSEGSLNLIHFDDNIKYPPKDNKDVNGTSDVLVSMQIQADLATDGPTPNMKKYVEETLIPMLQKQEQDIELNKRKWEQERSQLLHRIQQLELQQNNMTPAHSIENNIAGWDMVRRTEAARAPNEVERPRSATPSELERLKVLENHNKQLMDANRSWQVFYEKTQAEQQKTADFYTSKFKELTEEKARLIAQDEQKRADFEKLLRESKEMNGDQEALKEELQFFKDKVQRLETELAHLKGTSPVNRIAGHMGVMYVTGPPAPSAFVGVGGKTIPELQEENDTLRYQLTVFQEDFDRERNDRAQAQSDKEDLKTQLEEKESDLRNTKEQLKNIRRQIQHAEASCLQANSDKDSLQEQIADLKNKLRREKEANAARLQMQFQPIPNSQGYYNQQGQIMNGTAQLVDHTRVAAQPQTDPYAQPIAPFMVNNLQRSKAPQDASPVNQGTQVFNNYQRPANDPKNQIPGAWRCSRCTLENHPTRTVCEVCGHIRKSFNQDQPGAPAVPAQTLYRRGNLGHDRGDACESGDLSTDTGDLAVT